MPRTPVFPTDPDELHRIIDGEQGHVPDSSLQALMECAPHEEPKLSKHDLLPMMDTLVAALDVLSPRERWIVESRIWRRMSFRQIAHELALSKTHVDRIYKLALERLGDELRSSGAASDIARLLGRVDL